MATKTAAPPTSESLEQLAGNLAWLLSRASQVVHAELDTALAALGLAPRSFCVLSAAMEGEHTQTELAHAIGLDKTTMVVTLDELEAQGLAKRVPSSSDRRVRIVTVTKAGERKVEKGEKVLERVQRGVLSSLPAADRKALIRSLSQIVFERQ